MEFSSTEKREFLTGIGKEVSDFHPLLNSLFPKLPRVVDVKYTHGQQEWGADFVLTRTDDITELNEYIGAIVKIGKLHQNISEILQQIRECDEERIGPDSKKRIRLDEIWIVVNETITSGAEKNIQREFSTRKIKFYQSKDLIRLIDKHLPNFWYELPLETGEYLKYLADKIDRIEIETSLISIGEPVYINQEIIESDWDTKNKYKKNKKVSPKPKVKIINEILKNKVIFIEADAGFGKSKLLRNIARTFCTPKTYLETSLVPIFVGYKELCNEFNCDINKLIEHTSKDTPFTTESDTNIWLLAISSG